MAPVGQGSCLQSSWCEIGTRPAGTKAAEGDTVHAISPGLEGPDMLWAAAAARTGAGHHCSVHLLGTPTVVPH